MSGNLAQYLVLSAFFVIVGGVMFAEAMLLYKKGWASFARSFAFSALSNFIGFAVGLFVFFVVMAVFLMVSLDGTAQRVFESPTLGPAAIALLIFATLLTPFLLIICKRIFLSVLKMQTGKTAWFYALASSVLIVVVSLGAPVFTGFLLFR